MSRAQLRRFALHGAVVLVSMLVGTVLAEGLWRLVLHPVDYLAVTPVADSVLGLRIEPGAGGHDSWGFRNSRVPERADVVTIGDSQTYGMSAPAHLSWPASLAELTELRVYNLSLGGYSPVQYHELLRTRGLRLKPSVAILGFYYGNDLWDAHQVVYGLDHWAALRRPDLPEVDYQPLAPPRRHVLLRPLRDWLAHHSVLYRFAVFSILGGYAQQIEGEARRYAGRGGIPFKHPGHGASLTFTPRLKSLDPADPGVREGLRISLDRLDRTAALCRERGIHLLVALIPTKERVHAPWILERSDLPGYEELRAAVQAEEDADREIRQYLDARGIRYLDLSVPMREAAANKMIYPPHEDGHPVAAGYAVIADAVAGAIRPWTAGGRRVDQ